MAFNYIPMTELREDIVNGVAGLLTSKLNLDFSQQHVHSWLCEALAKYGEEGWRYHDSKSSSNYYRFKVWLLHLEAEVAMHHLYFTSAKVSIICKTQLGYKSEIAKLMSTIKAFDKMN